MGTRRWFGWMLAVAAVAVLGSHRCEATVIVGGNIINQTWTVAGSPYIVQGDITVPAGAFLTIQPGVLVQLASTDGQLSGLDTARVEVTIKGTLTASGSVGSPINFQAQSGTAAGTWYGIVIDAAAASATISNARIRHAIVGVRNSSPGTVLSLSSTTIDTCTTDGVLLLDGSPSITSVASNGNQYGFRSTGGAGLTLQSCSARGNSQDGVSFAPATGTASLNINHSTFVSNGVNGIQVSAAAGATA